MKKNFIKLVAFVMVFGFLVSGCTTKKTEEESHKLSIVTTIFPQYDFARAIVKDRADITMLLKPGAEAHSYEPTPQDIKTIEQSDVFIYVGSENDVWVDDILANLSSQPTALKLVDMVDVVEEEIVEGMEHNHEHEDEEHDHDHDHEDEEHEHEDEDQDHKHEHEGEEHHEHADEEHHDHEHEHHHEIDEHVWTSPKKAIEIIEKLAVVFGEKDPENAEFYLNNAKEYISQISEIDQDFQNVVKDAKRTTIVFGDRYPVRYFSDEYNLNYFAAFSGCSTDVEASAATIKFLIDRVNEENIPVVFNIELSNGKIADSIVDATGAKKLTFYTCHNVTQDQLDKGVTYVDMMRENVNSLKEALH